MDGRVQGMGLKAVILSLKMFSMTSIFFKNSVNFNRDLCYDTTIRMQNK